MVLHKPYIILLRVYGVTLSCYIQDNECKVENSQVVAVFFIHLVCHLCVMYCVLFLFQGQLLLWLAAP